MLAHHWVFSCAQRLVVMCWTRGWTRSWARGMPERPTGLLASPARGPKAVKTRVVHLEEGGEGLESPSGP